MFGFLSPEKQSIIYRSAYSRCCQFQRSESGLVSLPFLSYESVFLYVFWMEATSQDPEGLPRQRCCRLARLDRDAEIDDAAIGEFCAKLSMLLAHTKLQDDIRDSSSLRARIATVLMSKSFRGSRRYFEGLESGFATTVEGMIRTHLNLEAGGDRIEIARYTQPTAEAFSFVFRQAAKLPRMTEYEELLGQLGEQIGGALIAFDCAADWARDRRRGEFNPLMDWSEVEGSIQYSCSRLLAAESACQEAFGGDSLAASVIRGAREGIRIEDRSNCPAIQHLPIRRRIAAMGGVSSVLLGNSDSDSCCGAACCGLICLGILGSACKGEAVGSVTKETDCCGNEKAVVRKAGACDNC